MNTAEQRCANPVCACTVSTDTSYCCDHCRKVAAQSAGTGAGTGCECGHSACTPEQSLARENHI